MMKWKPIEGFQNKYEVSDKGFVSTIKTTSVKIEGHNILSWYKEKQGYRQVGLLDSKRKKYKVFRIHRLVAEAFIPKVKDKNQINHKNGNKEDNNVKNLEWCTPSENLKHSYKIGTSKNWAKGLKAKDNPTLQRIVDKAHAGARGKIAHNRGKTSYSYCTVRRRNHYHKDDGRFNVKNKQDKNICVHCGDHIYLIENKYIEVK